MPFSEDSHRVLVASGSIPLLSHPRRGNPLMGDQSDLLAEYEPPSLHLLKFARRLCDMDKSGGSGGGGNE